MPTAAALLLMGDMSGLGGGVGTGLVTHNEPNNSVPPSFGDALLASADRKDILNNFGPSFNDLTGIAEKINAAPNYSSSTLAGEFEFDTKTNFDNLICFSIDLRWN